MEIYVSHCQTQRSLAVGDGRQWIGSGQRRQKYEGGFTCFGAQDILYREAVQHQGQRDPRGFLTSTHQAKQRSSYLRRNGSIKGWSLLEKQDIPLPEGFKHNPGRTASDWKQRKKTKCQSRSHQSDCQQLKCSWQLPLALSEAPPWDCRELCQSGSLHSSAGDVESVWKSLNA